MQGPLEARMRLDLQRKAQVDDFDFLAARIGVTGVAVGLVDVAAQVIIIGPGVL